MLEDLLFNPFMFGVVYPLLVLSIVTSVLVPISPTKPVPAQNIKFKGHIYVSSTWAPPKVEPYKRTVREDPAEAHPIFDEMEQLIRESEARMDAAMKAHKILAEIGWKVQNRNNLAFCS